MALRIGKSSRREDGYADEDASAWDIAQTRKLAKKSISGAFAAWPILTHDPWPGADAWHGCRQVLTYNGLPRGRMFRKLAGILAVCSRGLSVAESRYRPHAREFQKSVMPVLSARCVGCHSAG